MSFPGSQRTSADPAEPSEGETTPEASSSTAPSPSPSSDAASDNGSGSTSDGLSDESRAEWEAQSAARPRNKRRATGMPVPGAGTAKPSFAARAASVSAASTSLPPAAGRTGDTPAEGGDTASPPADPVADDRAPSTETVEKPAGEAVEKAPAGETVEKPAADAGTAGEAEPADGPAADATTATAAEADAGEPAPAEEASGDTRAEKDGIGTAPVAGAAHADADRAEVRRLTVLSVAAVLLVALAVVFGVAWNSESSSGPTSNRAFVDSGTTAEVVGQVTNAIITVYSYNYTTLPQNETAAKGVITGRFAGEFDKVFAPVKQLAPQQQAMVQTTVPAAAVAQLQGDRARLLMMVNQTGTRGPDKQPTQASARLVVDAQKVAGQWKISEVTPE
jgi:Mce-associated membrane protein